MKARLIALILALAILVIILILFKGLAAEAQPAGKVYQIGVLGMASTQDATQFQTFEGPSVTPDKTGPRSHRIVK